MDSAVGSTLPYLVDTKRSLQSSSPTEYAKHLFKTQDISLTQCNNGKSSKHDFKTRKYLQQNNNKSIKLHQFAQKKNYEGLLSIDANEPNILHNNGVSQFLQHTKLIDIIDKNYRLYKVLNTHI